MSDRIDHNRFFALLTERFPEVASDISECSQGLLHLEMAALARATETAIEIWDATTVARHFAFVDELFRSAAPDVENAIFVSYLENICFDGRDAVKLKVRDLLSPRLRQALAELEEYLDQLHGR